MLDFFYATCPNESNKIGAEWPELIKRAFPE